MLRRTLFLFAGCLAAATAGYARGQAEGSRMPQKDLPELRQKARLSADELLTGTPARLDVEWLREEVNPILRERREIRRMMEARAQGAVQAAQNPAPAEDPHATTGNWRFSFGNTSVSNWSPYPDRMLDARTLSFPTRRQAKAGKRP